MAEDISKIRSDRVPVDIPRILIAAGKSGAGKTVVTCGILEVLKRRGVRLTAYKCGPDYIDTMFHREVLGINGCNLDTFLCGREAVKRLLVRHSASGESGLGGRMAVIEGVMGYYDGLGGVTHEASTYDVACATGAKTVLVVDCKGASLSVIPYIQGFLKYKDRDNDNSRISGVILNRISFTMYKRMKRLIEEETSVSVYGYVPEMKDFSLESRYLGLMLPCEVKEIKEKLKKLGDVLEETLDIAALIELAVSAEPFYLAGNTIRRQVQAELDKNKKSSAQATLRIGVAADEAFCFIYQDNLDLLAELGAEIVPFSPLHDRKLPEELSGILFYGGYPELYARKLSGNKGMRKQIREVLSDGLPCMAECGGFMYLTESIRDEKGNGYPMCKVLEGESFYTPSLQRFGYLILSGGRVFGKDVGDICAHEFHYYDSEKCGEMFEANKPLSDRTWRCMISTESIFAGYPHIHYAGNEKVAEAFIGACRIYSEKRRMPVSG